jgi:dienelactone hydrolase
MDRQTNVIQPSTAAVGAEGPDVRWAEVVVPDLGTLQIAIAQPAGSGPFPTVIVLHGTHGFAREYVEIAAALARKGVFAFAA